FGSRYMTEENAKKVKALKKVADGLELSRTQLALAWVLRQKGVSSAITGATKPEQIKESLGAGGVDLPQEALDKIEKILNPA
ncbi:MAG: aldo/keto reductase, partial [Meiothermus sp.]